MSGENWYAQIAGRIVGPLSEAELRDLARRGGISPDAPVSADRTVWIRAEDAAVLRDVVRLVPPTPAVPTARLWIVAIVGGVGTLGLCGTLMVAAAFLGRDEEPAAPVPAGTASARIEVRWDDATEELRPLLAQLAAEEREALIRESQQTGSDIYALRVVFRNVGGVPVRIDSGHLRIHFGGEAAVVYSGDGPPFLYPAVVPPGGTHAGIVTYVARSDIGAQIRLGGGAVTYGDPSVEVVEDR